MIMPGLIDVHVHLRDPGQTHKEDFYTGTSAAMTGGFTTILDMPNNSQPITTLKRLQEKIKSAKKKIVCDIGFYFGSLGDNTEEFKKIAAKVFGIKLYLNKTTGNYVIDEEKLLKIYKQWTYDQPILIHSEDETLDMVLNIVRETGKKTHICHVSSAYELKQIIKAKENGLPVTCGVTPHHLFLTEHDGVKLGSYGRMKPSLKSKKDVGYLWNHIPYIDIIESDHAPHTIEEKKSDRPPYGVPGLETTLPLLLTFYNKGKISIKDILRLCFHNPKKIFHIPTDPQTKIEIDEKQSFILDNKKLKTKCTWSPFMDWKLKGKVTKVSISGATVFKDDTIVVKPGFGKVIYPSYSIPI